VDDVELEIRPAPSDEERRAIVAALAGDPDEGPPPLPPDPEDAAE
jgi:hypothetical protein